MGRFRCSDAAKSRSRAAGEGMAAGRTDMPRRPRRYTGAVHGVNDAACCCAATPGEDLKNKTKQKTPFSQVGPILGVRGGVSPLFSSPGGE